MGAIALYRCSRRSFGIMPSLGMLVFCLFLPTLFVWSISALKEPSYFFLAAVSIVATVNAVRSRGWQRGTWVLFTLLAFAGLFTLRSISLAVAGGGIVIGLGVMVMTRQRWLTLVCGVLICAAIVLAGRRPAVQTA